MPLTAGTSIGRYTLRAVLGHGGMGEVYTAHDPTLGRTVAIKLLRPELSSHADGIARFLQEARAASALNHPNILTIHEVGEYEGSRFIVSELVEGETLRDRMQRGPLALRDILDIAIQAASALTTAHAAGIVHRDIKPDNLMIRPDGYVKVLDFGVAKLGEAAHDQSAHAATVAGGVAPTMGSQTSAGMVVGTIAYMSPEQARGLAVDGRADCFSLGVVLYELVTGRQPFDGPTMSDVLVAILDKEPPPVRQLARGLPIPLEWIIAKALDKDLSLRYQTMGDLRVDLARLKNAVESGRLPAAEADISTAADQPVEIALTDDSPAVRALGARSRASLAFAALAAAAIAAAFYVYPSARPGSGLPLEIPQGAAVTEARNAIEALGYTELGALRDSEFENTLDVGVVSALGGGRQAVIDAIGEGEFTRWAVAFTKTRNPGSLLGDAPPQEGEFSVRINPRGRLVSFATGLSQQAAAVERERATAVGVEALRTHFNADASGYELEFVQRAFPAGTVEMTWRNPARRFGHIEQFRVHLQGEKIVRLERSLERPPGFSEPTPEILPRVLGWVGPVVIGSTFVAAWVFGLVVLVRTKTWDALRQRIPIALSALFLVGIALNQFSESGGLSSLVGVVFIALFMAATLLPAMAGVVLWIRRRSPARLWAAEQLTHGRLLNDPVAMSCLDGVIAGALISAVMVGADLLGLQVSTYLPSISRELDAVDGGIASPLSNSLIASTFLALGIAIAVEALAWAGVKPLVATLVLALVGAMLGSVNQQTSVGALPAALGQLAPVVMASIVYRARGLLACLVALLVMTFFDDAMAARSLDDPGLVSAGNFFLTLIAGLAALGMWSVVSSLARRRAATSS